VWPIRNNLINGASPRGGLPHKRTGVLFVPFRGYKEVLVSFVVSLGVLSGKKNMAGDNVLF